MSFTFSDDNFEQIDNVEYNVCNGTTVEMSAVLPYTNNIKWYKNNVVIPNQTGITYTVNSSGTYVYTGCTNECPNFCHPNDVPGPFPIILHFGTFPSCILSVKDPEKPTILSLHPNPTTQFLYIGRKEDKVYADISIIDVSGKLVLEKKNHRYNEAINVSLLAPANYFIICKTESGKLFKNKFIKK
jgi:hypothetical protein